MDFQLIEDGCGCAEGFRELLGERGYDCRGGILVHMSAGEAAEITGSYRDGCARLCAPGRAFLFRALMTLVMRLERDGEGEPFAWAERVAFDRNGCMIDCSRNAVMDLSAAKAWMRMQAAVGMNTMMLYTEDTYEVPGYPYFGALRGRYTREELMELDRYAQVLGIELIPCIQSLGHLQQPLGWPAMRRLRDTSDIVMVGDEEVYTFLRACIHQVSECFSTRRVHLGMDEAWTLGLGQYLIRNGYTPKRAIIRQHMERVMEICREEGLEPMIWSDMYFRVHSETEEYYDVPFDADMQSGERPPEGMTLVYWDYYHTDETFYRHYLRMHRELTDRVIFAGGAWTWSGLAPDLGAARAVTAAALGACRAEQVREVVCTLWGDDGTETPVFSALGPVLLAAEYGFGEIPEESRVQEKFEFLTGCSYDAYCLLGAFDRMEAEVTEQNIGVNPSKCLFFEDPMLGRYDGQTEGVRYGAYYRKLGEQLAAAAPAGRGAEFAHSGAGNACGDPFWAAEMRRILDFYRAYAEALSQKADLGLTLVQSYESGDRETLKYLAQTVLPKLRVQVEQCRRLRRELWLREAKVCGWEILDMRYHALEGRLTSAAERVEDYLSGRVAALPELSEARPAIFPDAVGEKRLEGGYVSWINVVSASSLAWSWMPQ